MRTRKAGAGTTAPSGTGAHDAGQPDATSGATIVMLTAAHDEAVQRDAEEAGADLFLTKPFSPLDLLRLVDRIGE